MNLEEFEEQMLNQKIYLPYFISNSTIIEYHNQDEEPVSLMQIIQYFITQRKQSSKLYFKVNMV